MPDALAVRAEAASLIPTGLKAAQKRRIGRPAARTKAETPGDEIHAHPKDMPPMLIEKINADLIATMKDREPSRKEANQGKVVTLRSLMAEIKAFQVNNRRDPSDDEVIAIVQKGIKQFRETLDKANGQNPAGLVRPDIVEQEKVKIALYEAYLPAQLSREEIEAVVKAAIAETGAAGPKDMGAVMAAVRPKTQGKADGKLVSEIVKAALG